MVAASIRHFNRYYMGIDSVGRFHRNRIVSTTLFLSLSLKSSLSTKKLKSIAIFPIFSSAPNRFAAINCGIVYLYCLNFQKIDEDEYGGIWELLKEGFITSFACFSVTWIVFYTGLHFDDVTTPKPIVWNQIHIQFSTDHAPCNAFTLKKIPNAGE